MRSIFDFNTRSWEILVFALISRKEDSPIEFICDSLRRRIDLASSPSVSGAENKVQAEQKRQAITPINFNFNSVKVGLTKEV